MRPPVLFADSHSGKVAYQVVGDGPIDLVFYPSGGFNLDLIWDYPPLERYLRRLASFSRLILFNPVGFALSDPMPLARSRTGEEASDDLRSVLDAAGSQRAALLLVGDSGVLGIFFAATFPECTRALVFVDCYATLGRHDDYPWGIPPDTFERLAKVQDREWATGERVHSLAPEMADDGRFLDWYTRLERGTMAPSRVAESRQFAAIDNRGILSSVRAPTLVITHEGHPYVRPDHGRYLAEHITNARLIERRGFFGLFFLHDVDGTLEAVQSFLTGTKGTPDMDDRVLATVLFTDIVGSTKLATSMGDRRWRDLIDEHDRLTRQEIERFRGRFVKSTGDGVLATFDGPARAIHCALALTSAMQQLGIEVRTGLHTGEIELREGDVGGIAVHIAQRVMSEAAPGHVFVSGAVPPLVAGSMINFEDRGSRTLKGVTGDWRLFEVLP
jgi:class 3 adenylate cyclase